jgi:hypothetical protein
MRALFVLKRNMNYGFHHYCRRSSGLWNSTRFIVEGLQARGVHAEIVEVHDGNDIDREVTQFDPDLVVIEALWMTPAKARELLSLQRHKHRKFYVHMHSGLPFLAQEGIAMEWLSEYPKIGVGVIANSPETFDAFRAILPHDSVTYLPNVYIPESRDPVRKHEARQRFDIGCFGAIRPMKNQLAQAIAAIRFSEEHGRSCRFHINGSRIEVGGSPILKNLIALFEAQPEHRLVQHDWMEPDVFIDRLHEHIDIGMQVSLTETFNVVSADYVTAGLPIVVSSEVPWCSKLNQADPDSIDSMVHVLNRAWKYRLLIRWNQRLLENASQEAQALWFEWAHFTMRRSCS